MKPAQREHRIPTRKVSSPRAKNISCSIFTNFNPKKIKYQYSLITPQVGRRTTENSPWYPKTALNAREAIELWLTLTHGIKELLLTDIDKEQTLPPNYPIFKKFGLPLINSTNIQKHDTSTFSPKESKKINSTFEKQHPNHKTQPEDSIITIQRYN